jgi:hypothetical protein
MHSGVTAESTSLRIEGIRRGTSSLLKRVGFAEDGRINLTLRRVVRPSGRSWNAS